MDIEIIVKHENKRVAMQMSKYEYDFAKYKGEVLQSMVDRLLEIMQKEIEKENRERREYFWKQSGKGVERNE